MHASQRDPFRKAGGVESRQAVFDLSLEWTAAQMGPNILLHTSALPSMTRITGHSLIATPCFYAQYSTPRYGSMNFSALAYWTDGETEGGLMPRGGGLRKCKCGEFYLLQVTTRFGFDAPPDTPPTASVSAFDLSEATLLPKKTIELVARRLYRIGCT